MMPSRLQPAEQGHGDAEIAVARGDVLGEVVLNPAHLVGAGQPGQPAADAAWQ